MGGPPRAPAGQGRRTAHTSMVTHVTDGEMEALRDRVEPGLRPSSAQAQACALPGQVLAEKTSLLRRIALGECDSCASPSAPAYQAWP